jgi:hypothetical protein
MLALRLHVSDGGLKHVESQPEHRLSPSSLSGNISPNANLKRPVSPAHMRNTG